MGGYNFKQSDITKIKKYITQDSMLEAEEIIVLMKGLGQVGREYKNHMQKLCDRRYHNCKRQYKSKKTEGDNKRLRQTMSDLCRT